MAKLADILFIERERKEKERWNEIHLFTTGGFYSAYEWSAWLTSVISYNDEVRKQSKDRMPLAVSRNPIASSEGDTFCRVGFPIKSVAKFIPTYTDFKILDDSHILITISLPTPTDGSEITYERLEKAFNEWKESHPIKQPKEKKPPDKQKTTVCTSHTDTAIAVNVKGGIITQIMQYPLSDRTAMENFDFIKSLQQQIASII